MGWIFFLYPRAGAILAATLLAFTGSLLLITRWPIVGIVAAIIVAIAGTLLVIRVAQWEARKMGGTGHEGSGWFQSRDTPRRR
jgi:hypothetical protein